MNNKNYPTVGLKASYCLLHMSLIELFLIVIMIIDPIFSHLFKNLFLLDLLVDPLNQLEFVFIFIAVVGAIVWIAMFLITRNYQHGNSFHNYWLSWRATCSLRQANKIKPQFKQVKIGDTWRNQKIINPIDQEFNYAIKGWFIDQRTDALTIWLLVPDQADAQAIFEQRLPIIESNIRHDYHDFTFSPAERVGNYYRILANKF